MAEILQTYGLQAIIIIILFIGVLASGISWWWKVYSGAKIEMKKHDSEVLDENKILTRIDEIEEVNDAQDKALARQSEQLSYLVESDKSRIKGELIKQYQYFNRLGYIDSRSLDYLHQQYEVYKKEGGNSWASAIIEKIDDLPLKKDEDS